MAEDSVKKTAESEGNDYKNLKQLSSLPQSGEFTALLGDIRKAGNRLHALIKKVREKERLIDEARRAEETARRQAYEDAVRREEEAFRAAEETAWAAEQDKRNEEAQRAAEAGEPAAAEAQDDTPVTAPKPAQEKAPSPQMEAGKPSIVRNRAPVQTAGGRPLQSDKKRVSGSVPAQVKNESAMPKFERFNDTFAPRSPAPSAAAGGAVKTEGIRPPSKLGYPTRSRQFGETEQPPRRPIGQGQGQGARPPFGAKPGAPAAAGQKPPFNKTGASSPFGAKPPRPFGDRPAPATSGGDKRPFDAAKKKPAGADDKKGMNKRTLIRKGFVNLEDFDDERAGNRRKLKNKKTVSYNFAPVKLEKAVITTENLTVKILSEKIGKTANEIIKQLMSLGIMASINSVVDFATMELVANELGIELELRLDKTKEQELSDIYTGTEGTGTGNLEKRPPIVTVMGHVDHGKTSLLDALRKTDVAAGEAGGITQHIGAYTVSLKGESITFIDTPGHEAFTAMRARGAGVTDVAIIVVAADDGVMPQTVEAISHAKAAKVPIIVAVNKMDKPGATPDRIMQQITEHGLLPEEWSGDTIVVPVSAKSGFGLDKLLESILLVAEVRELKADKTRKASGTVIEGQLDKGRGPVATVIIQNGTLRVGDSIVAGVAVGKIRAMLDDKGASVKEAGPSKPVSILGFTEVPAAGDAMYAVDDEKFGRQLATERRDKVKEGQVKAIQKASLEDMLAGTTSKKTLKIIVKADVQGSLEALKAAINKLSDSEIKVETIHGGVGGINKSDVMLAEAGNAVIVGFNVRPDHESKQLAEHADIDIKLYRIIYDAIDDITAMVSGMQAPKFKETVLGRAEVRNVFKVTGVGTIAGSYILSGKVIRGAKLRLLRDNVVIYEGNISGLKRFKDDAKEVLSGFECGIGIEGYNDIKELDVIEAYAVEKVAN